MALRWLRSLSTTFVRQVPKWLLTLTRFLGEDFIHYLRQELSRCQYVLLVQTPQALHSLRVQTSVGMALFMVARQRLLGIWRLMAVPSKEKEEQPSWLPLRTIDGSQKYIGARDRLFQELGLRKK